MQIVLESFQKIVRENVVEINEEFYRELRKRIPATTSDKKIEETLNNIKYVSKKDAEGRQIFYTLMGMAKKEIEKGNSITKSEKYEKYPEIEYGYLYIINSGCPV